MKECNRHWTGRIKKVRRKMWDRFSDAELFTAAQFTTWKWAISCSCQPQIPTQCTSRAILVSAWNCCGEDLFPCSVTCSVTSRPEWFLAHSLQMLEGHWAALSSDFQSISILQEWAMQNLYHSRNCHRNKLIALWSWSLYQHITSCNRLAMATRNSPPS